MRNVRLMGTVSWAAFLLVGCMGKGGENGALGSSPEDAQVATAVSSAPVIEGFYQSESLIDTIRPVRLSWKVQNAARVDIWDGFRGTLIPQLGSESTIEVWPERTSTYRLMACNAENVCQSRDWSIQWAPLSIDYLMASPNFLDRQGVVQVRWKVRGASRVDILDESTQATMDNVGSEGIREFLVDKNARYTLMARAGDGNVQTQQVAVAVQRTDVAVIENFNIYPPVLQVGGCVEVGWNVDYATNVEIVDGFSGRTYTQLPERSLMRLFMGRSSTITLRVTGQNGAVEAREMHVTVERERPEGGVCVQDRDPLGGVSVVVPVSTR